jgi:hypothetical protein
MAAAEWSFDSLDDFDSTDAPAPAAPTTPAPAAAGPAAAPVPAPTEMAADPVRSAMEQIKSIRADLTHELNPINHHGDVSKKQAWDALYQQGYGQSSDPAHVATATEAGGWGPAAEAVAELREICSREGHLPQFQGREMTGGELDELIERAALATGDAGEAKRLVSEISLALWNSNSLDRRAEQEKLREEWGPQWDENLRIASRAVAQVFPDRAAEAGKFAMQHPRLMRVAVAWAERQARRGR